MYPPVNPGRLRGAERERLVRHRAADVCNPMTYQLDSAMSLAYDEETGYLYWCEKDPYSYIVNRYDAVSDSSVVLISREWQPAEKPDSVYQALVEM